MWDWDGTLYNAHKANKLIIIKLQEIIPELSAEKYFKYYQNSRNYQTRKIGFHDICKHLADFYSKDANFLYNYGFKGIDFQQCLYDGVEETIIMYRNQYPHIDQFISTLGDEDYQDTKILSCNLGFKVEDIYHAPDSKEDAIPNTIGLLLRSGYDQIIISDDSSDYLDAVARFCKELGISNENIICIHIVRGEHARDLGENEFVRFRVQDNYELKEIVDSLIDHPLTMVEGTVKRQLEAE